METYTAVDGNMTSVMVLVMRCLRDMFLDQRLNSPSLCVTMGNGKMTRHMGESYLRNARSRLCLLLVTYLFLHVSPEAML